MGIPAEKLKPEASYNDNNCMDYIFKYRKLYSAQYLHLKIITSAKVEISLTLKYLLPSASHFQRFRRVAFYNQAARLQLFKSQFGPPPF